MTYIKESKNNGGNLSRRGFVKSGLLGSLAAAVLPALGFDQLRGRGLRLRGGAGAQRQPGAV